MDIKEFIELHEYINSCLYEKDEELIQILYDIKCDLNLIKEKFKIKDQNIIEDITSGI